MVKFEIGKEYMMRSPCDYDCKWTFAIVKRTEKSVWLKNKKGETFSRKIKVFMGSETCLPLGAGSMSPVLSAD